MVLLLDGAFGGLSGAGHSEADNVGDFLGDTATGTAIGVGLGGGLAGSGHGIGVAADKSGKWIVKNTNKETTQKYLEDAADKVVRSPAGGRTMAEARDSATGNYQNLDALETFKNDPLVDLSQTKSALNDVIKADADFAGKISGGNARSLVEALTNPQILDMPVPMSSVRDLHKSINQISAAPNTGRLLKKVSTSISRDLENSGQDQAASILKQADHDWSGFRKSERLNKIVEANKVYDEDGNLFLKIPNLAKQLKSYAMSKEGAKLPAETKASITDFVKFAAQHPEVKTLYSNGTSDLAEKLTGIDQKSLVLGGALAHPATAAAAAKVYVAGKALQAGTKAIGKRMLPKYEAGLKAELDKINPGVNPSATKPYSPGPAKVDFPSLTQKRTPVVPETNPIPNGPQWQTPTFQDIFNGPRRQWEAPSIDGQSISPEVQRLVEQAIQRKGFGGFDLTEQPGSASQTFGGIPLTEAPSTPELKPKSTSALDRLSSSSNISKDKFKDFKMDSPKPANSEDLFDNDLIGFADEIQKSESNLNALGLEKPSKAELKRIKEERRLANLAKKPTLRSEINEIYMDKAHWNNYFKSVLEKTKRINSKASSLKGMRSFDDVLENDPPRLMGKKLPIAAKGESSTQTGLSYEEALAEWKEENPNWNK